MRSCGWAGAAPAWATQAARSTRSKPRAPRLGGALVPGFVKLIDALESEIAELPAPPPPRPIDATLTVAEISVLELLPTALTVREIADRLEFPLEMVRAHVRRIRRKLGATTRAEAVTAAHAFGLL